MMKLVDILSAEHIICNILTESKKKTLELASKIIADQAENLEQADIFAALIARERLGSTAIGHGVALPHSRLPNLVKPTSLFMRLEHPVDFNSPDDQPVDMVLVLLVPENEVENHLALLAGIANLFNQETVRNELRHAPNPETLYEILTRHYE